MSFTSPASPLPDLPQPVALVCHDAGGANQIGAWLSRAAPAAWRACVQGPARSLWERRLGRALPVLSLEQALDGARCVVSGTGWASDLEHRARMLARERGLPSYAVLDHWVNYEPRFVRGGEAVWPDEFWVTDEDALAIARTRFAGATVRLQPGAYMDEQLTGIAPVASAPPQVLYVLEPLRTDWGRGAEGEFQALDWFLGCLPGLGLPSGVAIRLRPHPADAPGKYQSWIAARGASHGLDIGLDASPTLAEALSSARWVAGCESYALVVALRAGRRVFGTLPPWAPPCRLPQAGIEQLAYCGIDTAGLQPEGSRPLATSSSTNRNSSGSL